MQTPGKARWLDAYIPTPAAGVGAMLDAAGLVAGERHCDLGSGDGRIVRAALARGALSVGYELDEELVRKATEAGGTYILCDFMAAPIGEFDVITAVVSFEHQPRLRAKFWHEGKDGSRLVFSGEPPEVLCR